MKHIPHGDENAAHLDLYLFWSELTWAGINYGFSFPAVGSVEKTSPGWLEPVDLTVSEHVFCAEHLPGSGTIFPPLPLE